MKHFALTLPLILLAGCSGIQQSTAVHPNLKPMASMTTTPYVEFMGDDQIQAVVAFANNPLWKCTSCAQGQVSSAVLAEVPQVIALHPDIVVIQTGAYDLITPGTSDRAVGLSGNVAQILNAFGTANIPAVICMLPTSTEYEDYYFNEGLYIENQSGTLPNVFTFNQTSTEELTAGIDYTPTGLMAVYPVFYQQVETFGLGGVK